MSVATILNIFRWRFANEMAAIWRPRVTMDGDWSPAPPVEIDDTVEMRCAQRLRFDDDDDDDVEYESPPSPPRPRRLVFDQPDPQLSPPYKRVRELRSVPSPSPSPSLSLSLVASLANANLRLQTVRQPRHAQDYPAEVLHPHAQQMSLQDRGPQDGARPHPGQGALDGVGRAVERRRQRRQRQAQVSPLPRGQRQPLHAQRFVF